MAFPGLLLLLALPAILGLPLGCVALILRLCEHSWQKRSGSMGSIKLFWVSGLLCLPVAAYLIVAVIRNMIVIGKLF